MNIFNFFNNKGSKDVSTNVHEVEMLHKNLQFVPHEQYKVLRESLSFTLDRKNKCHVIGVTSSEKGEGKSTTSINLSYVLAENGHSVLLIDGDMRMPSVAKKLGIMNLHGLSNHLISGDDDSFSPVSFELDNWFILPSGKNPPNPSELLGSDRMGEFLESLQDKYDYVIIDLPPVNLVSDVLSVSRFLEGLILVVRHDYSDKREFKKCINKLEFSKIKILGIVTTMLSDDGGVYGKYKYKRKYRSYDSSAGTDNV